MFEVKQVQRFVSRRHGFTRRDAEGLAVIIEEACEHRKAVCVNASVWEIAPNNVSAHSCRSFS